MIRNTKLSTEKLYDQDYQLWLETTLQQLRHGKYSQVDWENLLEDSPSLKPYLREILEKSYKDAVKIAYKKNRTSF